MRLAACCRRSYRPGPIFYRPNVGLLYVEYDSIARTYTGWNLTEIRRLNYRQRQYWTGLIRWRREAAML